MPTTLNLHSIEQNTFLNKLNPEQREAVLTPMNMGLKVVAGAGTGKTYLMTHRFVHLAQQLEKEGTPNPQDRILAVTFTVKAAEEMKKRLNALLTSQNMEPLSHHSWVTNFHGFCNRLVQQYAKTLKLSLDFTVLSGLEKQLFIDGLMQQVVNNEFSEIGGILSQYGLANTPDHILSLQHLQTLPIRNRAAFIEGLPKLIDKIKATGLSPQAFLTLATKQTKAFSDHIKHLPTESFESNYDYGQALERHMADYSDPGWTMFDTGFLEDDGEKSWRNQLEWLANYKVDGERLLPWYDLRKKSFLPASGAFTIVDELLNLELEVIQIVAAIYAVYQNALLKQNSCDFDDLINHSLTLLKNHPEIRSHYQQYFKAIIVDEFQDSNASQLELVRLLMSKTDDGCNLTVVGDLKQSIYGFRFAQPENMAMVFDGIHQVQEINLQTNYRSRPEILTLANHMAQTIVGNNSQHLTTGLPQTKAKPDWAVTEMQIGNDENEETKQLLDNLQHEEAHTIADKIETLLQSRNYEPKDIAVLVKNHRKADRVSQALKERQIASVKEKYPAFLQEPVILDAIALLKLINDPEDELSLVRLLQKKLSHGQLKLLAEHRRQSKQTLYQTLIQLADSTVIPEFNMTIRTALVGFVEAIQLIQEQKQWLEPVAAFLKLIHQIGLINPDTPPIEKVEQRVLLNTFKNLMVQLAKKQEQPDLPQLVTTMTHLQENPDLLELPVTEEIFQENAVRLLTIYAAKGLEFPVVFVAACDSSWDRFRSGTVVFEPQFQQGQTPRAGFGLFWTKDERCQDFQRGQSTLKQLIYKHTWQKPRALAEAKRLFYVAITRAQYQLTITTCAQTPEWISNAF